MSRGRERASTGGIARFGRRCLGAPKRYGRGWEEQSRAVAWVGKAGFVRGHTNYVTCYRRLYEKR